MNQDLSTKRPDGEHIRRDYQLTPKDERGLLWFFLIGVSVLLFLFSKSAVDPWWSDLLQNLGAGFVGAIVTYFAFDIFLFRKQREEYQQNIRPITERLDLLAAREVLPLRVYARVSLWLYEFVRKGIVDETTFHSLLEKARDEAIETTVELTRFSAPIAAALSEEQLIRYASLVEKSDKLWLLLNRLATHTQLPIQARDFSSEVEEVDRYRRESFERAIEFAPENLGYTALDELLQSIKQGDLNKSPLFIGYTLSFVALESLPSEDIGLCKKEIGRVHEALHGRPLPWSW